MKKKFESVTPLAMVKKEVQKGFGYYSPYAYYEILGLQRTATVAKIRKAYRKLNLKYHPDKNLTSKDPTDKEKLQELKYVYAVLSDNAKKKIYDIAGIDMYNSVYKQFFFDDRDQLLEIITNDVINSGFVECFILILHQEFTRSLLCFFKKCIFLPQLKLTWSELIKSSILGIIFFPILGIIFAITLGVLVTYSIKKIIEKIIEKIKNKDSIDKESTKPQLSIFLIAFFISFMLVCLLLSLITLPIIIIAKPIYDIISAINGLGEYDLKKLNPLKETLQSCCSELLKNLGIEELISKIESDITLNNSKGTKIENLIKEIIECNEFIKIIKQTIIEKDIPSLIEKLTLIKDLLKQENYYNSMPLMEKILIQTKIENLEKDLHAIFKENKDIKQLITDIKECLKKEIYIKNYISTELYFKKNYIEELFNDIYSIECINTNAKNIEQEQIIKLKNMIQECINLTPNPKKPIQPTQEPSSTTLNNGHDLNRA